MNRYVLTLVFRNDLEEKARKEFLETVTKNFEKVEKEENWGSRDLAYPINKQTKGYYVHYTFTADPKTIAPLDKQLKLEEDVIRYLLIRD